MHHPGIIPRHFVIALPIVFLIFVWGFRIWTNSGPLTTVLAYATEPFIPSGHRPPPPASDGHNARPGSGGSKDGSSKGSTPSIFLGNIPGRPSKPSIDLADPEAPFVGWPLQRVCDEVEWVDGLVYICDNNSGGVGNIRNYIQTCVRYALEAGARGLLMPKIRRRSETDLADLFTTYLPFEYMFDATRFRDAFRDHCPQITLYNELSDIPNVGPDPEKRVELITPKDFSNRDGCDLRDQNRHTDQFGDSFRFWLTNTSILNAQKEADNSTRHVPSHEHPRLIRFNWGVLWDYQTYRDGPEFYASFGGILKFSNDLIYLGKRVVESLRLRTPTADEGRLGEDGALVAGVMHDKFLGVHLRTENDALDFWPHFDAQAGGYIAQAKRRGFRTAFLATGNATEGKRFADQALREAGLRVYTARELLDAEDLARLDALSWDQRGVVDFIALLASDHFVGVSPSSFSILMAMRRHLRVDGLYTRPFKLDSKGDGLSYLVGKYDRYWDHWIYMWDGMWP